jgi:anti-anti-sigma regulatory factor
MTATNRGGEMKLCNLTQKLKDVFVIMRLHTVFHSYGSEAEAIASARVPKA